MIRTVGLAFLAFLATSASLDAQGRDHADAEDGPVHALIEMRTRIGLTDDQVTRLRALDSSLQARNEPVVSRLMAVRRSIRELGRRRDFTSEQRAQYEAYLDEARPLMKQIRENNNAAMRQIGSVLTEVQRRQLSEILRERDTDDNDRRGRSRDSRRNG
ncbi:MAG TPA: hypothetical protein VMN39_13025 [Longimicrobiaceae bacterium]|nr:hypothetical protein [Longimicrobiaceae bacterium]